MKAILLGDVVGEPCILALEKDLPLLLDKYKADLTVVNGENAAEGFGMTEATLHRILASGADVVTSGNHVWEERDFWSVLENDNRILRPANYPPGVPGRGWTKITKNGLTWLVINLQGRDLMRSIDCPFRTFDAIMAECGADPCLSIVDFHAESTREKEALGFYLDSRVNAIVGTHTHVQTADNRLLPGGTAYITDLGMTGVQNSIIGMDTQICIARARKQVLYHMECAEGHGTISGVVIEIDAKTRKTLSIERI
jgi:metallophosphoesterase (TIGR00282 family)